jgi:hypothetical protein
MLSIWLVKDFGGEGIWILFKKDEKNKRVVSKQSPKIITKEKTIIFLFDM